jgi:hypothetical protein
VVGHCFGKVYINKIKEIAWRKYGGYGNETSDFGLFMQFAVVYFLALNTQRALG